MKSILLSFLIIFHDMKDFFLNRLVVLYVVTTDEDFEF